MCCAAIQTFTKNATQWKAAPLSDEEIAEFKKERERTGIYAIGHDSYLINLGSPDKRLWEKSINAFLEELERAEALELPCLVMHPGSHKGAGDAAGLSSVSKALNHLLKKTSGFHVKILLENTAGQGAALGSRFKHLQQLIENSVAPDRLGVCLDTCHAFVAGYDLRGPRRYEMVMDKLDNTVGIAKVGAIHLNDAMKGLGQRVDRHQHIGRGMIGRECFRLIMNDRRFEDVPKLIETPKEWDGEEMDPINLGFLRSLVRRDNPV